MTLHTAADDRGVLLVGNFLHAATGTFCVCEGLAVRLRDAGWRVVTTSHRRQRVRRLADMLTTIWQRRHDYDVAQVDVYSGAAFFWAEASCWLLRRLGCPYVLTLHGGALPAFAKEYPKRTARLLRSAAAVTSPSDYLRTEMAPYRPDVICQVNPMAIGDYTFHLRRHLRPRLVWVRAFHDIYNPTMGLRVLANLAAEFPDIHLLMVGPDRGDGTLALASLTARDLNVEDRVEFRGAVPKPQLPSVFHEGDIFLNTANVDNTPVTVVEAMASGLCVVSTCVGGIPYMLRDGIDALLVPPGADGDMSDAVKRLLNTPALAEQLSRAGRENAESRDWSVVLPEWERLLGNLSGARERAVASDGDASQHAVRQ